MNAIIIDDEQLGRDTISGLLATYCPGVSIVSQCDTISSAKKAIAETNPDLVFLDVSMPGGDGFDLLRSLEEIRFEIIFVTAHNHHILKALRFNAIDYLLKPVDEEELVNAVDRAAKSRNAAAEKLNIRHLLGQHFSTAQSKMDSLCIPTGKGFQVIKLDEIICCEARNTYTVMYLPDNRQVVSTKPLMDYDTILSDSGFMRVHKSWLINRKHIKEYTRGEGGTVRMSNNKEVDVSRRKKEYFLSELKKTFKF